jgi:hypothetical protein
MTVLICESGESLTFKQLFLRELAEHLRREGRDVRIIDTTAQRPRLAVDNVTALRRED